MRPLDTSEEAWARVEEGIRGMTREARFARVVALTIMTHRIALAQIRSQHPDEDERTSRLRLAARYIDAPAMRAAFAWPP